MYVRITPHVKQEASGLPQAMMGERRRKKDMCCLREELLASRGESRVRHLCGDYSTALHLQGEPLDKSRTIVGAFRIPHLCAIQRCHVLVVLGVQVRPRLKQGLDHI